MELDFGGRFCTRAGSHILAHALYHNLCHRLEMILHNQLLGSTSPGFPLFPVCLSRESLVHIPV